MRSYDGGRVGEGYVCVGGVVLAAQHHVRQVAVFPPQSKTCCGSSDS